MYADDFEVFDVVSGHRDRMVNTVPLGEHVVYIDKKRYDAEVRVGQEHAAAAYAQLARDMPRCSFYLNGRVATRPTSSIPVELIRFCTQAVLALPIELLMRDGNVLVVCDAGDRMQVHLNHKTVDVRKTMRVFLRDGASVHVHIWVNAGTESPIACISFVFGKLASDEREHPQQHASASLIESLHTGTTGPAIPLRDDD